MSTKDRIIYADLLRIMACLAVIVLHVAALNWYKISINSTTWQILNIYDSLVRWCVPIFIMLSGMFFLNPKKNIKTSKIYIKYIPRILISLIGYSIFYYLFLAYIDNIIIDKAFIIDMLRKILNGNVRYHLWFLYIIIGLYIVTPLIRVFINGATKRQIEYFLLIGFIFSIFIPTLIQINPFDELLVNFNKLQVNFMGGYGLYYVLGYYLSEYEFNRKSRYFCYSLGVVSAISTISLTYIISIRRGGANTLFYEYMTPNVMFMSVAVFILFRYFISKINFKDYQVNIISKLSAISFNIYLIHDAIMVIINKMSLFNNINSFIMIPLKSFSIFIVSIFIALIILKINEVFRKNFLK